MDAFEHEPVLVDRVAALLGPALAVSGAVFVDATLGLGGHAATLLDRNPSVRLVGVDRDSDAVERARRRLATYGRRVVLRHAAYDQLPRVLAELDLARVQGVLFDLGVSSLQLDAALRGFSYSADAPLDMRMDPAGGISGAEVVNSYPTAELIRILREYGEERFAGRIARALAAERAIDPIVSTTRLAGIVRSAVPAATRRTGGHPAKRTFQALRIEVNGELDMLARGLPAALGVLATGGRLAVLAYHSLEDRLVKRTFAAGARDTTPPDLPVSLEEHRPPLRLLTRGAEQPQADEVARNPRAASARLRVVERIREEGSERGRAV